MADSSLPLFLNDTAVRRVLDEVITATPEGTKTYLHGGALRNAIYYYFFNEIFPQRDFDLIVIGDRDSFASNLLKSGFSYGNKNSKTAAIFRKVRKKNPSEGYADWVYLDVVFRENTTIEKVLKEKVNFTINGTALELPFMNNPNWFEKLVTLPGALEDLRVKQLRTNSRYPINIYACVRFVSRGFAPPPREEINNMMSDLREISDTKFRYNVEKVVSYVGGPDKAREIAKKLAIKVDILDLKSIRAISR